MNFQEMQQGIKEKEKEKEKAFKICRKLLPKKWKHLGFTEQMTFYNWVAEHLDDFDKWTK